MDDAERDARAALHVIERMLFEGFATGRPDIVDELCAPDLVEHQFGLEGTGPAAIDRVKRGIVAVHRAMPDIRFSVEDWAVRGDTIWVRAEATGTNTGPFLGERTGLPVRMTVIDVARIVDGRITEHWGVPDRFALLAQTGRLGRLQDRVTAVP